MKNRIIVAAGLAVILLASAPARGFTFDDIHFWVGTGTNRMAVVVDWDYLYGSGTARVWGFRWNGDSPSLSQIVRRIDEADPRLSLTGSNSMGRQYDLLNFFAYDVADCNAAYNTDDPMAPASSSPTALLGCQYSYDNGTPFGGWTYWGIYKTKVPGDSCAVSSSELAYGNVANNERPENNQWYVLRYGDLSDGEFTLDVHAAESPYGYRVRDCKTNATAPYADPSAATGRPTDYMEGSSWTYDGVTHQSGVIHPFCGAWGANTSYSLIGNGAYVVIEFDHDVIDDPANPYGVDFIVFGNSFAKLDTDRSGLESVDDTDDPETIYASSETDDEDEAWVGGPSLGETAVVAVSQDGKTWFEFEVGPYADSSMPTLGRLYDRDDPDTTLFTGNLYWGGTTNPLYPVDPKVSWNDMAGLSLAEICRRYNGSAGGTGYDLGTLNLPANAQGRKWFRYVRIANRIDEDGELTQPDIDAVADVAPVSSYRRWICANFTWDKAYRQDIVGPTVASPNGTPNVVNAVLGVKPDEPALGFTIRTFTPASSDDPLNTLEVMSAQPITDMVMVKGSASLTNETWSTEFPLFGTPELDVGTGLYVNRLRVSGGENRFFKLSVE